jgi:hypothetical protein
MLRELVKRGTQPISLLLRQSSITSTDPRKVAELKEICDLGIQLVQGDLVCSSEEELAAIFKIYHTIISCTGYVAGGPRYTTQNRSRRPASWRSSLFSMAIRGGLRYNRIRLRSNSVR